jgi:hypothetical protein
MVIHHLVTDGYSNGLLQKRLISYYQGKPVPARNVSYIDFIAVQQNYLQSPEGLAQLAFWEKHLEPFGQSGKPQQLFPTEALISDHSITGTEYRQMFEACKRNKVFMSSFIISAFYIFKWVEYREQEDQLAGIVVNGRDIFIPGFEVGHVIGQFVNMLPLRLVNNENRSVEELIKHVQDVYMEGRLRQEIPSTVIERAFINKYGFNVFERMSLEINYTDNSTKRSPENGHAFTKKGTLARMASPGCLMVKCNEYQDALHLEWSIPCREEQLALYLESDYFIERINAIIRLMINEPQATITSMA